MNWVPLINITIACATNSYVRHALIGEYIQSEIGELLWPAATYCLYQIL
jgi:hypothetical protein